MTIGITRSKIMKDTINIELIENYIKDKRLTKKQFCSLCNISYGTLNKLIKGQTNIRIRAIIKIVKTIGTNLSSLFFNKKIH